MCISQRIKQLLENIENIKTQIKLYELQKEVLKKFSELRI